MKIFEAYKETVDRLRDRSDKREAESTARILFEDLAGSRHPVSDSRLLGEAEELQLKRGLQRLLGGEPINYVTGIKEFYGLRFKVNPNVLIPRPETEELVEWVTETLSGKSGLHILDIGTGSGCIPITIDQLTHGRHKIAGCDVSTEALALARSNNDHLNTKVDFFHCDILDIQDKPNGKYDVIISNPPYILHSEDAIMDDVVVKNEPEIALFVTGKDPMQFYKAINQFAKGHLKKNGWLFYEISTLHKDLLETLMDNDNFDHIEFKKDMSGNWRMCKARII
ncbi:MAG: peptide chain release factor N(5)-glutamine methyltransferase [Bacteroidia bacterium]|nr:peptide chain release factor N(5)-glutamine methyltransferase [Bacteroidia bacterium]